MRLLLAPLLTTFVLFACGPTGPGSGAGGGGGTFDPGPWDGRTYPSTSPKASTLSSTPPSPAELDALLASVRAELDEALGSDGAAAVDAWVTARGATTGPAVANLALAEWLQRHPLTALALMSRAVALAPDDALLLHNFAALLTLNGYAHVAVPLLNAVLQREPSDPVVAGSLAAAWYDLGVPETAMGFAAQALAGDPRHFGANKVMALARMQLAGGQPDEPTRALVVQSASDSLAAHPDPELVTLLGVLEVDTANVGRFYDAANGREFELLKSLAPLPVPTMLEDTPTFEALNKQEQDSLSQTARAIDARVMALQAAAPPHLPQTLTVTAEQRLAAKADAIVKAADAHRLEKEAPLKREAQAQLDALHAQYLAEPAIPQNAQTCDATNARNRVYLAKAAAILNDTNTQLARLYRDTARARADWLPIQMTAPYGNVGQWVLAVQELYVGDVKSLDRWALDQITDYRWVCQNQMPPAVGVPKAWEDAFCASFKAAFGVGPASLKMNCDSFEVEAGEGLVGGAKVSVNPDGSFKELTLSGGVGAKWHLGSAQFINVEAGATVKPFVTIGADGTGVGVTDVGLTGEATVSGGAGSALEPVSIGGEVTVVEVTAAWNGGVKAGGVLPDAFSPHP